MKIVLASGSPRRTQILSLAHIEHIVIPSTCVEVIDKGLKPIEVVESLSLQKAKDVARNNKDALVIGADTIVTIDGKILGKPHSEEEAIEMLTTLSNTTHQVVTGVTFIYNDIIKTIHEITEVTFSKLSTEQIKTYINEENVYDKAGAYAIQGTFCKYITKINGDYYNVMGLPIARVYKEIEGYKNEIQ